jgi:release factor glutamine methyltransferase
MPDLKTVKRADIDHSTNRLIDLVMLGAEYLVRQGVEDARLDAEMLAAGMLGVERIDLYMQFDRPLTDEEKNKYRDLLIRRGKGEPTQYINGKAAFRELDLFVKPGVLIPRPETELLVTAAERLKPQGSWSCVLDVGCGSGAIALSLLEENLTNHVVAVDVSPDAVGITHENALSLGFTVDTESDDQTELSRTVNSEKQVLVIAPGDAFSGSYTPPGAPFPLILSNPPYVAEHEYGKLPKHVRKHEPRDALLSGEDGMDAHRALAKSLSGWLAPDGVFFGEIGYGQGALAKEVHGSWASTVEIHRDYSSNDRFVEARP